MPLNSYITFGTLGLQVSPFGSPSSSVQADGLFAAAYFMSTLLEPINVKHFLPKHELNTEDDGDPFALGTMTFGQDCGWASREERNPDEHTTHETNHR